MKHKQNLHTHTTYCDGKQTPEEVIRYAMEQGFDSLGFSEHSYMSYSPNKKLSLENTQRYKQEIRSLKQHYGDRFPIFLGLEVDMYSNDDQSGFDYLIGAVHYLNMDGEYVAFDRPAQTVKEVVDTRFGGDGLAFAKRYYQELARLPQYGSFDILGHFDLVTKNIEHMPTLLDTQSKAYLDAAKEAIHALKGHIPLFEVNTGAIARGHRTTPYPAPELVREFREAGFGAVISSDCHDAAKLDCAFEDARALLEAAGFRERYILTGNGFRAVEL